MADPAGTPVAFDLATIAAGLPFAQALPELREALKGGVAVVHAPPGSGKTTLVPPLLAAMADVLGQARAGGAVPRVVVTQPRRIAVRAAARRLATLSGGRVGGVVGYTVRGERHVGPATRVEFCTPGVLLRRLLADPELPGVGAVVLDEVHERGLETDLLVGMLAQVRELRGDLGLVAMSATLDADRFAALLGGAQPAPIVASTGALHPVSVRWAPAAGPRFDARGVSRDFLHHVAQVTVETIRQTWRGARTQPVTGEGAGTDGSGSANTQLAGPDALVFVPGAYEVGQVASRVRAQLGSDGVEVLELHGQIPSREQDRITAGRSDTAAPRRVVVSTAIAESSLTVPDIGLVVDAGLSREPRRDAARGMSGLVTVAASQDAAIQRAGRAARLGPGLVVRCYDEETFRRMPPHLTPQIAVADLTEAALLLAWWGTPQGRGLPLPDAPPAAAMADAVATLRTLGAVTGGESSIARDDGGRITDLGRALAQIPAEPRLARALLDGAGLVGARTAADVVAALSDDIRSAGADLAGTLGDLRGRRHPAASRWADQVRRFVGLVPKEGARGAGVDTARAPRPPVDRERAPRGAGEAAGLIVALAYPERIGRRDGDSYLLASGTRAALPAGSPLSGQDWLAIADVARAGERGTAGTGAVIRLAAPLSESDAMMAAAHLRRAETSARWRDGRVTARRVDSLGAIELSSTPVPASAQVARRAVTQELATQGLDLLPWSEAATSLRLRLATLRHHLGDPWPDVSDAALLDRLEEWLGPELDALAGGVRPERVDVAGALRRLLPWPEAARLDDLAPERLTVPSGSRVRISYAPVDEPEGRPVVAVRLQECFGWAQTPRLLDGRVLFHLLSPAGRPLAVTDDLASFWSGPYAQVRAEMRGRYPKHPWPQDPWSAPPTARTRRRPAREG